MDKIFSQRGMVRHLFCFIVLFIFNIGLHAQGVLTVEGVVLDKGTKETMIGVTVVEKGVPSNGAITDANGRFSLKVKENATIQFSYIGYKNVETSAQKASLEILMEEDSKVLDAVVVVGYGTQKKANLTGAVAALSGDEISGKSAPNIMAALQGELPGITVVRSSGKPGGEGYSMRVRGFTSANATNTLVLIDGMEGDMNLLNPNDIESISVLKDAASSSIYGAKAAAGVILITTKKGQEGPVRINYNGSYSLSKPGNMPKRLNSWDEQRINDIARYNSSGKTEFTPEQTEWLMNPNFNYRPNIGGQDRWDYYDNVDHIKEGTKRVSQMQNHSVSLRGGSAQTNYLASMSYFDRQGILKYGPDGEKRYSARLNLNSEINRYLSASFLVSYNGSFVEENSNGTDNILNVMYRGRSRQPIYVPEEDVTGNMYNGDLAINYIDIMKNAGITKKDYEAFNGQAQLSVKNLVKGLVVDLSAMRKQDYYSMDSKKRSLYWYGRTTNTIRNKMNDPNEYTKNKNKAFHNTFQATATYDLNLDDKHDFKLLAGTSFEDYKKDEMEASAKNMINNDFFSLNYGDLATKTNKDKIETWAMSSYFGRFNYGFSDKYLFEANIRFDGSSRLAPDSRWKAFPSFSLGWRMNEENFMKDNFSWLTNLKWRASWGQLGNGAALGLYDYIPLIESGNDVVFDDQREIYYYQRDLASLSKTWETIETVNLGVDMGFLNNRLNVTTDYYEKRNKNMLAKVEFPSLVGVGLPSVNAGELKSWGWEFDLKWKDKIGEVEYWAGFNIADNQNKLVKYDGVNAIKEGEVALLEGYPLNTIWGYKTDGYFKTDQEYQDYGVEQFNHANVKAGDVKYLDLNGDGKISAGGATPDDPGDLVNLGTTNARYTYGITLGAKWNNIDVSIFLQGVGKRTFLVNTGTLAPMLNTYNLPWSIHSDYWTPENTNAMWPRLYAGNDFNYKASDKWVQDGSYIRLKNIQVGYTVPVDTKYIQKLRVYFSGDDLWEHTNVLKVLDPEAPNDTQANKLYPFFRTVSFGLNLTF